MVKMKGNEKMTDHLVAVWEYEIYIKFGLNFKIESI